MKTDYNFMTALKNISTVDKYHFFYKIYCDQRMWELQVMSQNNDYENCL